MKLLLLDSRRPLLLQLRPDHPLVTVFVPYGRQGGDVTVHALDLGLN